MSEKQQRKRLNGHEVIMTIVKNHKGSASLDEVEAEGQKVKPLSAGLYKSMAKADFDLSKEGRVLPRISQKGMVRAVKSAVKRGTPDWVVLTFPEQAKKVAAELKLTLPATASGGLTLENLNGHVPNVSHCPRCQILLDARVKFGNDALTEQQLASRIGLSEQDYRSSTNDALKELLQKVGV